MEKDWSQEQLIASELTKRLKKSAKRQPRLISFQMVMEVITVVTNAHIN